MQVRIAMLKAVSVGGQRAHDLRIGPQPDYVDPARFNQNRVLIEPLTGTKLRAICEQRRAQRETQRAMKSSASVGIAGIITFGHEAQKIFEQLTPDQQGAAYLETAQAVADRLNTTLTGLVSHGDESAPHAHFQTPAFDLTGHPVSETAKRGVLRDLQTITAQVMARHAPGIERGRSKFDRLQAGADPVDVVNKSVKELHDALPAEIAAKRAEADAARAALVDAQARVDEMQARVEKLQAKERDLTAAETKRLATYEKRLADRLSEVEAAEGAVSVARSEVDRLTGLADDAEQRRRIAEVDTAQIVSEGERKREAAAKEAETRKSEAEKIAVDRLAAADRDAAKIREEAVRSADAVAGAFSALAVQIRQGTISQNEHGQIVSDNIPALRPGGAPLVEVVRTLIPLTSALKSSNEAAMRAREQAEDELRQARTLRETLLGLVDRVKAFLRRPDVSMFAKARADASDMTAGIMSELRKVDKELKRLPAPKKALDEPDSGPNLG